jgi:hypothetical protein
MVDEDYGAAEAALDLAEEGEQTGHFISPVFILGMEADQRIEQEHMRADELQGMEQARLVGFAVQAQEGLGDDVEVEAADIQTPAGAEGFDALADQGEFVLGGEDEGRAGVGHGEAVQAGGVGGDAYGHVECQEGFACFGLTAEDSRGGACPQGPDEPAIFQGPGGDIAGPEDGEWIQMHTSLLAAATWLESVRSQFSLWATWRVLRARVSVRRRLPQQIS